MSQLPGSSARLELPLWSGRNSWLTNSRTSKLGRESYSLPHSGRSSFKWAQWTQWGCSSGSFLLPTVLVQFPHALGMTCSPLLWNQGWKPLLTTPLQGSRALMPLHPHLYQHQQAAKCVELILHPSGSHHVWHPGLLHSSWVLIPHAHHQHPIQEVQSFLWQCIQWPTWQGGSHWNQGRAHWWQQPWLQHQCWISSSGYHVWHHSHQRWCGVRAPF